MHLTAPNFGEGKLNESIALTVHQRQLMSYVRERRPPSIVEFGPGNILPGHQDPADQILEVGHTGAPLHATIEKDGGANITNCLLEYVQTNNPKPSSYPNSVPCSPDPAASPPASNFSAESTEVSGTLSA